MPAENEITKNLAVYIRTENIDFTFNDTIHIRNSQITLAPGAEWTRPVGWNYRGIIVVSVLAGEVTFTNRSAPNAGSSKFSVGTKNVALSYATANSHFWVEENPPANNQAWPDKTIVAGESVLLQNNFVHELKNNGLLDATLLVVAVINDDQCGARPCFTFP